jgi:hypothetical protein
VNRARSLPGHREHSVYRAGEAGHLLIEAVAAIAVVMVLGGTAASRLLGQRDSVRAAGAARHIGALAHLVRAESLKRGRFVGMVFQSAGDDYRFATFVDGDGDGVRSADVTQGIDRQVTAWACLNDNFSRATFGIVPGAADPESGDALSGSPLKLGGGSILSFGPDGTATSGTLYVRGPEQQQYAVRILGATGRTRTLRFDFQDRKWVVP